MFHKIGPSFGYNFDYEIASCCLHRLYPVVNVIPAEGFVPSIPSFQMRTWELISHDTGHMYKSSIMNSCSVQQILTSALRLYLEFFYLFTINSIKMPLTFLQLFGVFGTLEVCILKFCRIIIIITPLFLLLTQYETTVGVSKDPSKFFRKRQEG